MRKIACLGCKRLKIRCDQLDHPFGCLPCRKRHQPCDYYAPQKHVERKQVPTGVVHRPVRGSGGLGGGQVSVMLSEYFSKDELVHTVHPARILDDVARGRAPKAVLYALLATVVDQLVPQKDKATAVRVLRDRARSEMIRMGEETIHHAQTLALLAHLFTEDEASMTAFPNTISMSMRILLSYGVHRMDDDTTPLHPSLEEMQEADRETVRRLFWHLYTLDRIHAFLGNPFSVRDEDVCVRLFNDEQDWYDGKLVRVAPLFEMDRVQDNEQYAFGSVHSKVYFFQCMVRVAALLGHVRLYMDDVKRNKPGMERRRVRLAEALDTWWVTCPVVYTQLTKPEDAQGCYYKPNWVVAMHLLYYAAVLAVQSTELDALERCMGVLEFAMCYTSRRQPPIGLHVALTVANAYLECIQQHPQDIRCVDWRRRIQTCFTFASLYGMPCAINTYYTEQLKQVLHNAL